MFDIVQFGLFREFQRLVIFFIIIILLQITVAPDESLGRNRLLCFEPFTVIL